MQRATSTTIIAIGIALTFVAPIAGATWYFAQSFEPNTAYDTTALMWHDPPGVGETRIYFSAFSQYSFIVTAANPNVGLAHTQIETSNSEFHSALFGVWKDCNGDGYVGMAEGALREYSAALLASTTACPLVEGPANVWTEGAHNYNGWVSEFVPIARDPTGVDLRRYVDDDARVWGDYHRPDEDPWLRPCPLAPQPRGTYQSTGGMINFVDCRVDVIGVANLALDAIGDPAGWRFSDPEDARTGTLGQVPTFGSDSSSYSAVTVWDCSAQRIRVGDVANQTAPDVGPRLPAVVANVWVRPVDPDVHPDGATVPGTLNETFEGTNVSGTSWSGSADCDYSNDDGGDFYEGVCVIYCVGEGDFNGIDPKNKREAHFNMRFNMGGRGTAQPYASPVGASMRWNGPSGPANDHGLRWGGSGWSGTTFWLTKPGFGTVRTHLQDPTNNTVEIAPGLWLTWYAYVGKTTLDRGFALPGGGATGTYASWHCGSNTSGVHHGFNCDPTRWYINPDGTPVDPQDLQPGAELEAHELVRPGQAYHLRDVDCYDGRIRGADPNAEPLIGVQPAYYGEGACY